MIITFSGQRILSYRNPKIISGKFSLNMYVVPAETRQIQSLAIHETVEINMAMSSVMHPSTAVLGSLHTAQCKRDVGAVENVYLVADLGLLAASAKATFTRDEET